MDNWFYERSYFGTLAQGHKIKRVLHSETSPFQKIEVIETESVGRLLLLDGKTMVSEKDEFVYHEVVSHLPYALTRKCENVLIIGGGDGGVVREFARHKEIKKIDLLEIDERVIEVSRQFFPECTTALDDPRVTILAKDGLAYIKQIKNHYDIVVVDSTDPEDFASGLFTAEFYTDVFNALTETGIMVNQTENPFFDEFDIRSIYRNLKQAFPVVASFAAPMAIYPGVYWSFGLASKCYGPKDINPQRIPQLQKLERELKWYNLDWHRGVFNLGSLHKRMINL